LAYLFYREKDIVIEIFYPVSNLVSITSRLDSVTVKKMRMPGAENQENSFSVYSLSGVAF